MNIVSLKFMLFFAAVLIGYYIVPSRVQWMWLLAGSLAFYLLSSPDSFTFLVICVLSTYLAGLIISRIRSAKGKTLVLVAVIALNTAIMVYFKLFEYYRNLFLRIAGKISTGGTDLIQPLGISYFTLSSISYCIDVFRGNTPREKNIFRYMLFLSFFPYITQGPIVRYSQMDNKLFDGHRFRYINLAHGSQLALWGLFKKLVIADRLGIVVSTIFSEKICGSAVLYGSMLFYIQLYADFSGCMDIITGCSEMLDIKLPANFNHPFAATSVRDFWRRWHISFSSWLRDYIYIPLGGSRNGPVRKYINILIVFLVSGLWHGAGIGFVVWGMLHALFQIAGDRLRPKVSMIIEKTGTDTSSSGFRFLQQCGVFFLVSFAWIFFRAPGLDSALKMVRLIFSDFAVQKLAQNIYSLGINQVYTWFLFLAVSVLFAVEHIQQKICIREYIDMQPLPVRWGIYLAGIVAVVVAGCYGIDRSGMFLYAQF